MNNKFIPFILPAFIFGTVFFALVVVIGLVKSIITHPEVKLFVEAQQEEIDSAIASIQYLCHNIRAYITQLTVEPVVYDINYFE